MERITLSDTLEDIIKKLSAGNPGAMRVLFELMKHHPDGAIHILRFSDCGYYSGLIWLCYKDLCNYDVQQLFTLLKEDRLKEAINQKCNEDERFKEQWEYHIKALGVVE